MEPGPPADMLWLVQFLGIGIQFQAAPIAGDAASGFIELENTAVAYELCGVETEEKYGRGLITRGLGCHFIMNDMMKLRCYTDARASSVGVFVVANAFIREFAAL